MQSKNKPTMTREEREHVSLVKSIPCAVCDKVPSEYEPGEAHEIEQGLWFTSVGLCASCHRDGLLGLHGQRRMWRIRKQTELGALNETIRRVRRLSM